MTVLPAGLGTGVGAAHDDAMADLVPDTDDAETAALADLAIAATDDATVGAAAIVRALRTMPLSPGVYRMLDRRGDALYVGKARSLRKRVVAYTQPARLPERLRRMVGETASMEIVTTHTEAEALLLEANLIKRLKPRFNIVLRDDKSYPWLMLTEDHPFPQISKHRGAHGRRGSYWGPFASAWAVNQTVTAMQRVFLLRSCADTVFANRSRPCLLHQIKRCSAPCVGRIDADGYAKLVAQAKAFLSGRAGSVQRELATAMEEASGRLEFERAASLRDRIRGLTHVQGSGVMNPASLADADVIAVHQIAGQSCVQVFFVRGGRNNGNRAFFPTHTRGEDCGEVLAAFVAQFYDDKTPPPLLLLSHPLPEAALVADALTLKAGRRVELAVPVRGEKRSVVEHAGINAREAMERKLAESAGQAKLLAGVAALFGLPATPDRIEVYDNSHMMGTSPYGVMIVSGAEGFRKNAYRKYAIRGPIAPGDDFAMMREVLERRFGTRRRHHRRGGRRRRGRRRRGGGGAWRLAGRGADRRRRRAVQRGARGAGRSRRHRRDAGGDRQGAGPRRRAGMVPRRRPAAVPAAAARPGALLPAAHQGRGPPLRDHHPSCRPLEGAGAERPRRYPGRRRGTQARAAEPFRFGARRAVGRADRPRAGARHLARNRAAGVRPLSSGLATRRARRAMTLAPAMAMLGRC